MKHLNDSCTANKVGILAGPYVNVTKILGRKSSALHDALYVDTKPRILFLFFHVGDH